VSTTTKNSKKMPLKYSSPSTSSTPKPTPGKPVVTTIKQFSNGSTHISIKQSTKK